MKIFRKILDKLFINYYRVGNEVSFRNKENIEKIQKSIDLYKSDIQKNIKDNTFELKENIINNYNYTNLSIINDSKKNKILVIGFYGAPNVGDEMMLETLFQYFDSEKNEFTIMISDIENCKIDHYPNAHFISYPLSELDFNMYAKVFDKVVFGGGAIIDDAKFQTQNSFRFDLGTILIKTCKRFIACKKEVYCIGLSSSESLTNQQYINELSYIIGNSNYFSVRDNYSYLYLINLFPKYKEKIKTISDIVFSNKKICTLKKSNKTIKDIGVIWIPYEENNKKLIELLIKLTRDDYFVHLIPFYGYDNFDLNQYNAITSELKNDKIVIETFPYTMDDIIESFNKCDVLIAMRYHSSLIGNILGIPTISIYYETHRHYNNKIRWLAKMFDDDKIISVSEFNVDNLELLIQKAISNCKKNNKKLDKITNDSKNELIEIINMIEK